MSDIYHLYLDESETHNNGNNRVFTIAGIITEENFHNTILTQELKKIKNIIWSDLNDYNDIILHEKDIRFAQNPHNKYKLYKIKNCYHRFSNNNISLKLYTGLEKVLRLKEITVIGGCIVFDELYKNFPKDLLQNRDLILLQIIIENFCHFLKTKNGLGKVFYEHIEDEADKNMSLRFHQVKSMGTMYLNPYMIQKLILSIDFPPKSNNVAGLQIADFIPNDIARNAIGKYKHPYNLSKIINRSMYDGTIGRKDKYGVKILPRIT